MGYTNNSIFIEKDVDTVFDLTNKIDRWKDLFSEYQESTVLKTEGSKITFRLTTQPDEEDGHVHSWVSERVIDKANLRCEAKRLPPEHPFEYMKIIWEYEAQDGGTHMRWIQDFKVAEGVGFTDKQFEDHLNENTRVQMNIIKQKIENGFA